MVGFRETMTGGYGLGDDDVGAPLSFTVSAHAPTLGALVRRRSLELAGELHAAGFADHRPLRGELSFPRPGIIRYDFGFPNNDGVACRFFGEKRVRLLHLLRTMTELDGDLRDASGRRLGRARVRFDIRNDLGRFLRSFSL
ncbi:MAG: hypothetical protein IT373_04180 [Polyangiaceae bacterium]|nr:hypothetical protein [Polyangiaceae bacterium]